MTIIKSKSDIELGYNTQHIQHGILNIIIIRFHS